MKNGARTKVRDFPTRRVFLGVSGMALLGLSNLGLSFWYRDRPANQDRWQVKRVLSGQTIEAVPVGQNRWDKIRLIGVSAPLLDQEPWGLEARARLKELVDGKTIIVEKDLEEKDNTDRLLGYIWVEDRLINLALVREGYVLAEFAAPNERYRVRLEQAQAEARLLGIGIWDPQNPMRQTPREYFHTKQSGS